MRQQSGSELAQALAFGARRAGRRPHRARRHLPAWLPAGPGEALDAILKLRNRIHHTRLGANRDWEIIELEHAALRRRTCTSPATHDHRRCGQSRRETLT